MACGDDPRFPVVFQGEQSRSVAGDQVIRIRGLGEGEQEIIPCVGRPAYLRQSSNALCDFAQFVEEGAGSHRFYKCAYLS